MHYNFLNCRSVIRLCMVFGMFFCADVKFLQNLEKKNFFLYLYCYQVDSKYMVLAHIYKTTIIV